MNDPLTNFHFSGASLIVCFWAEVFHLQEIRWDRPRFLSKSFLGFVAFNIISYSLLIAELVLIWFGQEHLHFYKHIFNGSYAVLMFIGKYYFPSICTIDHGPLLLDRSVCLPLFAMWPIFGYFSAVI